MKSADNAFEVKFRGLVQGDGRMWFGDRDFPQNDTFLLRRVEPTIEGTWGSLVGFRLNAQFAGDSATINDAYIDLKFDPRATLRVGKAKTPVGLERLQSSSSTEAIELGFPSELAPGRDVPPADFRLRHRRRSHGSFGEHCHRRPDFPTARPTQRGYAPGGA